MNISSNPYNIISSCSIGKAMETALYVELLDRMYHRVHNEADRLLYNGSVYGVNNVNITFNINTENNIYNSSGKFTTDVGQIGSNINIKV